MLLLAAPGIVAWMLFARQITGVSVSLGRLTGMGLIALGVACWPSSDSRSAFWGMLTWSVLAMAYLILKGLGGSAGILLWPAVVVHAGIATFLVRRWLAQRKHLK